jgi:hypothetical protein
MLYFNVAGDSSGESFESGESHSENEETLQKFEMSPYNCFKNNPKNPKTTKDEKELNWWSPLFKDKDPFVSDSEEKEEGSNREGFRLLLSKEAHEGSLQKDMVLNKLCDQRQKHTFHHTFKVRRMSFLE